MHKLQLQRQTRAAYSGTRAGTGRCADAHTGALEHGSMRAGRISQGVSWHAGTGSGSRGDPPGETARAPALIAVNQKRACKAQEATDGGGGGRREREGAGGGSM